MKGKSYTFGAILIVIFILIAVISVFYTPASPYDMAASNRLSAPSLSAWFGTDAMGRDIFSRAMIGVRISLSFAFATLLGSAIIGVTLGLVAVSNKALDYIIMLIADAINSIPGVLLALVLLAVMPQGVASLAIAMIVIFTPLFIRVTRNEASKLRNFEYIVHVRLLGAGRFRIIFRHILPNIATPLISTAIIVITNSIMVETALSYLGMGVQPPAPSLGRMIFESQSVMFAAPWCAIMPGLLVVLIVAGFNYLGEGVRNA